MTLYTVFRQAMGRYSDIFEAPGNFGTKVKIVEFVAAGRKLEEKNCWTESTASSPRVAHAPLKNPEVSPSGPGALFGLSLKKSFLISSDVGIVIIAWACREVQEKFKSCTNQEPDETIDGG